MSQSTINRNILLVIKLSLVSFIILFSLFGFTKNAKAVSYTWDCFSYTITPDKLTYTPGETITLTASAWNDGCAYDNAWTNMDQYVERASVDGLNPKSGQFGTITLTAPMTVGPHTITATTHRHYEQYVYNDTFAPTFCIPDNWQCDQSCSGGWINVCWPSNCGFRGQSCTGGQRVSHSVIANCCGVGQDIVRTIPFTVVVPTASISAAGGTSVTSPLPHNGNTTITWNSANVNTGEVIVINPDGTTNVLATSHYETVVTTTNHPEQGYWLGPYCFYSACVGPWWIVTQAAYTSTESTQVLFPQTTGSKLSDKLVSGKNTIVFKGYQTGSNVPAITKSVDIYVGPSSITLNLSAKDPSTGQSVSTVTSGSSTDIVWSSTGAGSCVLSKNGNQVGSSNKITNCTDGGGIWGALNNACYQLPGYMTSVSCSSVGGTWQGCGSMCKELNGPSASCPIECQQICRIPKSNVPNPGSSVSGSLSSGPLTTLGNVIYSMTCTSAIDSETKSVTVNVTPALPIPPIPPIPPVTLPPVTVSGVCVPTQGSSAVVYVNKPVTWTVGLPSGYLIADVVSPLTTWTGIGISQTTSGNTLTKIYTTVGSTTISASLQGTLAGAAFKATCTASTIVRAGSSTVQEI